MVAALTGSWCCAWRGSSGERLQEVDHKLAAMAAETGQLEELLLKAAVDHSPR